MLRCKSFIVNRPLLIHRTSRVDCPQSDPNSAITHSVLYITRQWRLHRWEVILLWINCNIFNFSFLSYVALLICCFIQGATKILGKFSEFDSAYEYCKLRDTGTDFDEFWSCHINCQNFIILILHIQHFENGIQHLNSVGPLVSDTLISSSSYSPIWNFDSLHPSFSILPITTLQFPVLHQIHNSLYPCSLRSPSSFLPIWKPLKFPHWQSILINLQLILLCKYQNVSCAIGYEVKHSNFLCRSFRACIKYRIHDK